MQLIQRRNGSSEDVDGNGPAELNGQAAVVERAAAVDTEVGSERGLHKLPLVDCHPPGARQSLLHLPSPHPRICDDSGATRRIAIEINQESVERGGISKEKRRDLGPQEGSMPCLQLGF